MESGVAPIAAPSNPPPIPHPAGAVPVVEPGTKRLCGILSYVDVLKLAAERL